MLVLICYNFFMSQQMLCEVEKDVETGTRLGFKEAERYYKIKKIFYDSEAEKEFLTGKEILDITGRDILLTKSIGVTNLNEPHIFAISEKEKEELLNSLHNKAKKRIDNLISLINGWKDVSPNDREVYLKDVLQKIEALQDIRIADELRNLFIKEIKSYIEVLKNKAIAENKNQLYFKNLVYCNDINKECSYDLLCRYIDKEGKEVITREHCY